MASVIYKIESKTHSNKIYIGSAVNYSRRINEHLYRLRNKKHNPKLQNHYNKYGENDLIFSIVELCSAPLLIEREQFYIDTLKPIFNCSPLAISRLGCKHSEQIILKLKGRIITEETKLKLREKRKGRKPNIGYKHSEYSKYLMSINSKGHKAWNKGIPVSVDVKNKISNTLKGNDHAKGKHWSLSDETKKRMSESWQKRKINKVA